jgi:hypothetical protein
VVDARPAIYWLNGRWEEYRRALPKNWTIEDMNPPDSSGKKT